MVVVVTLCTNCAYIYNIVNIEWQMCSMQWCNTVYMASPALLYHLSSCAKTSLSACYSIMIYINLILCLHCCFCMSILYAYIVYFASDKVEDHADIPKILVQTNPSFFKNAQFQHISTSGITANDQ